MRPRGPKSYHTLAEFEREELRRHHKAGWSLDDLYSEAAFDPGEDVAVILFIDDGLVLELHEDLSHTGCRQTGSAYKILPLWMSHGFIFR